MKKNLLNRLVGVALLALLWAVCGEHDPRPALADALAKITAVYYRYKLLCFAFLAPLLTACAATSTAQREAAQEKDPHAYHSEK